MASEKLYRNTLKGDEITFERVVSTLFARVDFTSFIDSRGLLVFATKWLLSIKQIPEIVPFPFKGQPAVVNL